VEFFLMKYIKKDMLCAHWDPFTASLKTQQLKKIKWNMKVWKCFPKKPEQ
jgi:hypothetical protein